MQASNEDAKSVEISKLQKIVESLTLELDAAKLRALNEYNKNTVLQRQLDLSAKEKSASEREVVSSSELRNENSVLKVILRGTYCLLVFLSFSLLIVNLCFLTYHMHLRRIVYIEIRMHHQHCDS